ncbi:hypothetical protein F5148DRAFT_1272825 [Russula earlei]|uniref:Uncharacterized protein n=1 Tax=Russula earlei TaxID=71964 RepID=A0ACC0TRA3_9AGAM|nr:hypothetical protein F5148DRAFT_1272825 [Russula earlei]
MRTSSIFVIFCLAIGVTPSLSLPMPKPVRNNQNHYLTNVVQRPPPPPRRPESQSQRKPQKMLRRKPMSPGAGPSSRTRRPRRTNRDTN